MLSIIVPCFNEKEYINDCITGIYNTFKYNNDIELIVINDNSNDGSKEILERMSLIYDFVLINNSKNEGKGNCLKKGINIAKGNYIGIFDCDNEYDINDLLKMYSFVVNNRNINVVFGNRYAIREFNNIKKYFHTKINNILTFLVNLVTNYDFDDVHACLKVIKTDIIKNIVLKEKRFAIDTEICIKLAKGKYTIYSYGISYNPRSIKTGKKINMLDGLRCVLMTFIYGFERVKNV